MSEMIERVARAIYGARWGGGDWDALSKQRKAEFEVGKWLLMARAAIEAMKEPTKEMIDAGWDAMENSMDSSAGSDADGNMHEYSWIISGSQTDVYQTMIAAALVGEPVENDK